MRSVESRLARRPALLPLEDQPENKPIDTTVDVPDYNGSHNGHNGFNGKSYNGKNGTHPVSEKKDEADKVKSNGSDPHLN